MNKEFIPYEEALALKELGFDEPCIYYVDDENESFIYNFQDHPDEFIRWCCNSKLIKSPLYQQAFRWFREKYNWNGWTDKGFTETFRYNICENNGSIIGLEGFKTYEEAELACLRKLIEIVKEK